MRGSIVDARIAFPDVLHVEVATRVAVSGVWATQDAKWSPSDPARLLGRSIEDVVIDAETGELRCMLSDGSMLDVMPAAIEAEDYPPNWELVSPPGRSSSSAQDCAGRSAQLTYHPRRVADAAMRFSNETASWS
jgi:hypothetical protein